MSHRALSLATFVLAIGASSSAGATSLQGEFDPYPTSLPQDYAFTSSSGRTVHYATFGDSDGEPVLLLNGALLGHWAAVDTFDYLASTIGFYNLRIIQPERTGYGKTPFNPTLTPQEHVDDLAELMSQLGYEKFSVLAVSTGGISGDYIAVRHPSRIKSLHFAVAVTTSGWPYCPISTPYDYLPFFQPFLDDPSLLLLGGALFGGDQRDYDTITSIPTAASWFNLIIPTELDPINSTFIGPSNDQYTFCNFPLADSLFSSVTAPVFVYYGGIDAIVPGSMAAKRAAVYPNTTLRLYPNEGHYAVFRHAGQIMTDIAGLDHKTLLCHNGNTRLVSADSVEAHMAHGDTLDICAWKGTLGE